MAKLLGKLRCTLNLTIHYCTPSAQPDMSKDRQKTVVLWRCNTPKLPPQMGEMNWADLRGNELLFLILFEIGEEGTPRQIFSNIRHNFSANELASATVQSFEHKKWNPLYMWTIMLSKCRSWTRFYLGIRKVSISSLFLSRRCLYCSELRIKKSRSLSLPMSE